jgi:hypothetical protein
MVTRFVFFAAGTESLTITETNFVFQRANYEIIKIVQYSVSIQ